MLVFKKSTYKYPPQTYSILFYGFDILNGEVYEAGDWHIIVITLQGELLYVVRSKDSNKLFDLACHTKEDIVKWFKSRMFKMNHGYTLDVDVSALP